MKTIKFFLIYLLCFFGLTLAAKEIKYPVSDIPKYLLENSKAVIRVYNTEYKVYTQSSSSLIVKYAITILNKNAIKNSKFYQFYDKFSKVKNINAVIYDAKGNLVKKIKKFEILDYSAISSSSVYDDNRVKYIDPEYCEFPFTIEYSFEIKYSGFISYPAITPIIDYNIAVEKSEFSFITPINLPFRYKVKNTTTDFSKTENDKNVIYKCQLSNLKAIKEEIYSSLITDFIPIIYTAPLYFEMDGYTGSYESWNSFGKWFLQLNKDRNTLNSETQNYIKNLVYGVTDKVEKIKIIYNFFQNKTRYVSIQVGIGGFQTIKAEDVDKYCYGDCKALTNYMKSLLEIVDIKSYYTLVKAGNTIPEVLKDFPSNQFDHVILCIPNDNDTIWLECTNQFIPFGYLGTFTDNRDVLLITEDGGKLAHTPIYSKSDNIKNSTVTVNLDNDLSATVKINTRYSGLFYDEIQKVLHSDDIDKKRLIKNNIKFQDYELLDLNFKESKNIIPFVDEELNLSIPKYGVFINNKILLPFNLLNKIDNLPLNSVERFSDIHIQRSYIMTDSISFFIPENYSIEQISEKQTIKSDWGEYSYQVLVENMKITYIRIFSLNRGVYPAKDYQKFTDFFEKIHKLDELKCIIKKTN